MRESAGRLFTPGELSGPGVPVRAGLARWGPGPGSCEYCESLGRGGPRHGRSIDCESDQSSDGPDPSQSHSAVQHAATRAPISPPQILSNIVNIIFTGPGLDPRGCCVPWCQLCVVSHVSVVSCVLARVLRMRMSPGVEDENEPGCRGWECESANLGWKCRVSVWASESVASPPAKF